MLSAAVVIGALRVKTSARLVWVSFSVFTSFGEWIHACLIEVAIKTGKDSSPADVFATLDMSVKL